MTLIWNYLNQFNSIFSLGDIKRCKVKNCLVFANIRAQEDPYKDACEGKSTNI